MSPFFFRYCTVEILLPGLHLLKICSDCKFGHVTHFTPRNWIRKVKGLEPQIWRTNTYWYLWNLSENWAKVSTVFIYSEREKSQNFVTHGSNKQVTEDMVLMSALISNVCDTRIMSIRLAIIRARYISSSFISIVCLKRLEIWTGRNYMSQERGHHYFSKLAWPSSKGKSCSDYFPNIY